MLGMAFAYIAAAFFMARISLAAAMAAGDPGLSVGAAGCWAPAGTPASASPSTRPAADKILKRRFIPNLHKIAALPPFNNTNSLRARQHRRAGKTDEQPMLDNARYRVQQSREMRSIADALKMGIDNPVAAIGDKNVAVPGLSDRHLPGNAAFRKCPADGPPRRGQAERNDLDWQRKAAENLDPFGIIGDHDHAIRRRGHDLFAQQCAATALDEVERGIDFIRAIDRQIEPIDVIERGQRNAAAHGIGAGRLRRRHADDVEPGANPFAQQLDKMLRGRTGAEAELHAVGHEFERAARRLPFQFVHAPMPEKSDADPATGCLAGI